MNLDHEKAKNDKLKKKIDDLENKKYTKFLKISKYLFT